MNSRSAKPGRTTRSNWQKELEVWHNLLGDCHRKPTRKRVHLLRVATLRLQAQVQHWLDRHPPDHPAARAAKGWNKQAKYLRRVLGVVRACDVHLASLSRVRAMLTTSSGYQPRSCRATLRQVDALEGRFRQERKRAARDLVEALASRRDRVQQTVTAMASEPDLQRPLVPILASSRLAEMLGAVVSAFPTLDAESLHDFRKQLKSVRYLAEVAASGAAARQLAATVKSVQGTIGEWHDWEELAAEARRAFRNEEALVELLRILIAESFERALTVGESLKRQFLPAAAMVAIPAPPLKKLVQSAEAVAVHKQLISA